MSRRTQSFLLHSALVAGGAVTLFPLFWMISASIMATGEATSAPPHLLPAAATLDHYRELFVRLNIGRAFFSSAVIASTVTVLSVLFGSMAGYAFARLRFAGRERLFRILLVALIIPPQVGMLPLFLLMKKLHLVNSYWGAIIPSLATVFGIFLIRQFMLNIPQELLEAARIDGASEWKIYRHVLFPQLSPIALSALIILGHMSMKMFDLIYVIAGPIFTPIGFAMPRKNSTCAPSSAAVRMPIHGMCVARLYQRFWRSM